jgi:hypothetical protein
LTGRSSTPLLLVSIAGVSGILGRPVKPGDDSGKVWTDPLIARTPPRRGVISPPAFARLCAQASADFCCAMMFFISLSLYDISFILLHI